MILLSVFLLPNLHSKYLSECYMLTRIGTQKASGKGLKNSIILFVVSERELFRLLDYFRERKSSELTNLL